MGRVSLSLLALIDSGAEDNLLDTQLAQQLGCAVEPLENPIPALALNGEVFTTITHKTSPVAMTVSGNHHEKLTFHLLSSPHTPIVLGHPWLKMHNPHIDWSAGKILGWSSLCHSVCLKSAQPAGGEAAPYSNQVTPIDLTIVPPHIPRTPGGF